MKTISVLVKLDQLSSNVQKHNVTPAEVALLTCEHQARAGGQPLTLLPDTEGDNKLSKMQEYNRLIMRYGSKKVKNLFPSATAPFPETFDEAIELGMGTAALKGEEAPLYQQDLATA